MTWIQTFTGKEFYPLDPKIEDINIVDIGHSLSMQCRFNGHSKYFYSVAEHCLVMSYEVPPKLALQALLHDAAEAYLCDLPRPLKHVFPIYQEYEKTLQTMIYERFGISEEEERENEPIIKVFDARMLITEAKALMKTPPKPWFVQGEVLDVSLMCHPPHLAHYYFKERFKQLYDKEELGPQLRDLKDCPSVFEVLTNSFPRV